MPLFLHAMHYHSGETVAVKATAIMSGSLFYTSPPPGMDTLMALSALDVSRAVPLVEKCMKKLAMKADYDKREGKPTNAHPVVLVIGCGKAGVTCISLLRTRYGTNLVRTQCTHSDIPL